MKTSIRLLTLSLLLSCLPAFGQSAPPGIARVEYLDTGRDSQHPSPDGSSAACARLAASPTHPNAGGSRARGGISNAQPGLARPVDVHQPVRLDLGALLQRLPLRSAERRWDAFHVCLLPVLRVALGGGSLGLGLGADSLLRRLRGLALPVVGLPWLVWLSRSLGSLARRLGWLSPRLGRRRISGSARRLPSLASRGFWSASRPTETGSTETSDPSIAWSSSGITTAGPLPRTMGIWEFRSY